MKPFLDTTATESWPGPFATARAIMDKRAEAKKARDEAIMAKERENSQSNIAVGNTDEEEVDIYESALKDVTWSPSSNQGNNYVIIRYNRNHTCLFIFTRKNTF